MNALPPQHSHNLLSLWLIGMVFLPLAVVSGQEATPVRSLEQTSPAREIVQLPSDTLRQERDKNNKEKETKEQQYEDWWEGLEQLAMSTMEHKRTKFGAKITSGWEYDDKIYLSDIVEGTSSSYYARAQLSASYVGGKAQFRGNYIPEYRWYDNRDVSNGLNHAATMEGSYTTPKWQLLGGAAFSQSDGANVEVGDRIEAITVSSFIQAGYQISPKTKIGASTRWAHHEYDEFNSYNRYESTAFVDYAITAKTHLGLGIGNDLVDMSEGLDSTGYNSALRIAWQASAKVSFRGQAGYEWRNYDGGRSLNSPTMALGFLYAATEKTDVTLDAYRRNNPSISEINQSYYATGIVASFKHKVNDRLSLLVRAGYELSDYERALEEIDADREDKFWFVRPELTYNINESAFVTVYYQYAQNDSSYEGTTFERNLIGASIGYEF